MFFKRPFGATKCVIQILILFLVTFVKQGICFPLKATETKLKIANWELIKGRWENFLVSSQKLHSLLSLLQGSLCMHLATFLLSGSGWSKLWILSLFQGIQYTKINQQSQILDFVFDGGSQIIDYDDCNWWGSQWVKGCVVQRLEVMGLTI